MNYHLDFWTNSKNLKKSLKEEKIYQVSENSYKLTIEEKQKILINNIYGVDIDPQAVEVTKLSLYLKLLENESKESEGYLFSHTDFKLLPSLDNNIKCGNSLIGSDFYKEKDLSLFGNDDMRKVNVFDWDKQFPEIFKNGGFDVVIGNPPYFNIQTLGVGSEEAKYIMKKYSDIWQDKSDILFYFIHKAISISKGTMGYIISNAFLFADKGQKLRNYILKNAPIEKIINFEQYQVFSDASITTSIIILNKKIINESLAISLKERKYTNGDIINIISDNNNYFEVNFEDNKVFALVDNKINLLNIKIDGNHPILRDVILIGKGMETAANEVFSFKEYPKQFPTEYVKKRMSGEIISRYFIDKEKEYLLYFEDTEDFDKLPDEIKKHLNNNKKYLENRATVKNEGRIWWRYSRPMHKDYYHLNKIWSSYRSKNNEFVYDNTKEYIGLTNTTVIFDTNNEIDLKYLLALLNSRLLNFRYKSIGKQTGSGVYEYFENGVGKLPIPIINKEMQNKFITLVDNILETQKLLHNAKSDSDKNLYKQKIDLIDNQIDNLVYKLYGLMEEEIKIVENKQ